MTEQGLQIDSPERRKLEEYTSVSAAGIRSQCQKIEILSSRELGTVSQQGLKLEDKGIGSQGNLLSLRNKTVVDARNVKIFHPVALDNATAYQVQDSN